MDAVLFVLVGLAVASLVFVVLMLVPVEYYPCLFFVAKFVAGRLIDFERVRYSIAFQLGVILVLFVFTLLRKGVPTRRSGSFARRMGSIRNVYLAFVMLNVAFGVARGWSKVEIAIDAYKYIEPVLYFAFFSFCWRSVAATERGVKALITFMVIVGLIEVVVTERGGVGLNLIVSLLPILIIYSYGKQLRMTSLLIGACLVVVIASTTRTYMLGVAFSLLVLVAVVAPKIRLKVIISLGAIAIVGIIVVILSGGEIFGDAVARILQLSEGFAKAGGYRVSEYPLAMGQWEESPLFGQGFGFERWLYVEGMGYEMWGSFMHNAYLEILLKVGVVGAVCLFVLLASYINAIVDQQLSIKPGSDVRNIALGGIIGTAGWLLIYAFAPLSSYGSIFIGSIVATVALMNLEAEISCEGLLSGNSASPYR